MMKIKKEISEYFKKLLNTHERYVYIQGTEYQNLHTLFQNYYATYKNEHGRNTWDNNELESIKIVHNKEEHTFNTLCFELKFKNGEIEHPSYIKAITAFPKSKINEII